MSQLIYIYFKIFNYGRKLKFLDSKSEYEGFSRTLICFQDFPGTEISIPDSRTFRGLHKPRQRKENSLTTMSERVVS